jgi:hypothetical protein
MAPITAPENTAPRRVSELPEQAEIGHHFDRDVDKRTDGAEEEDDEEPEPLRPAAKEVDDRQRLQQHTPGEEE